MKINKILIPVDGSKRSLEAIEYAQSIISAEGAEFHLINVTEMNYIVQEDLQKELFKVSDKILQDAAQSVKKHKVVKKSVVGVPYKEIVDYAEVNNIDLIVITRMGISGLQRYVIGSVTSKVVSHSHIPVLVIPEI